MLSKSEYAAKARPTDDHPLQDTYRRLRETERTVRVADGGGTARQHGDDRRQAMVAASAEELRQFIISDREAKAAAQTELEALVAHNARLIRDYRGELQLRQLWMYAAFGVAAVCALLVVLS